MPQEQEPQMNTPLTTEGEPSSTQKEKTNSADIKTEMKLKPPLVSEEDLYRMRAQIAGAFENSTHLPNESAGWSSETGKVKQGVALTRILSKLLLSGALKPFFRKNKKVHSWDDKDQKSA